MLKVVSFFCYLGDMLSAGGDYELAVTTSVKTTWKTFRELPPVPTYRHLSYKSRVNVYSSCFFRVSWSILVKLSVNQAEYSALATQRTARDQIDLQYQARVGGDCKTKSASD